MEGESRSAQSASQRNMIVSDAIPDLPVIPDAGLRQTADSIAGLGLAGAQQLKDLIEQLGDSGWYSQASNYSMKLASLEPVARNFLVAGAYCRNSLALPEISADTALFGYFSRNAIAWLLKAREGDPENEDAGIELALAYLDSRNPQNSMKGIMLFKEILEKNPDNEEAAFQLARSAKQVRKNDRAGELFREVLRINPANLEAKWELATLLLDMQDMEGSRKLLIELKDQEADQMLASAAAELLEKIKK